MLNKTIEDKELNNPFSLSDLNITTAPYNSITLELFDNLGAVEAEWRLFEQNCYATVYNKFELNNCWYQTIGQQQPITLQILVGRDAHNRVQFILPFQLRQEGKIKIIEWLGHTELNYGYGLYNPSFLPYAQVWFKDNFNRIRTILPAYDVIWLDKMPESLFGYTHPLSFFFKTLAVNNSYTFTIQKNYEELYLTKRSAVSRKTKRKTDRALREAGPLYVGPARSKQEAELVFEIMMGDKIAQLAAQGIHGAFNETRKKFLQSLIQQTYASQALTLTLVKSGQETVAVMLSGIISKTNWLYILSTTDGILRKFSPGDFLLRHIIETSCNTGLNYIDMGVGDAEYKSHWCDKKTLNYILYESSSIKGWLWLKKKRGKSWAIRTVKNSPRLFSYAQFLRKKILASK